MLQSPPLLDSLQQAMTRRGKVVKVRYLDEPLPSSAPDFFSNDYLSLASDPSRREIFLHKVQRSSPSRLFGSTGTRLMTGNYSEINMLETELARFFGAPSALLFGSGYSANHAFFSNTPRKGDVIIYDELVHASCREGIRSSSATSYSFDHNSLASFEGCLLGVLQGHPQIIQGTSTVFVAVETLYSMDGDFCPLRKMVDIVEILVPSGHAHIVVDEAHTSGICGPNGAGYVSHLGLNDRVHTTLHTFGKAWGFHGAVLLTSPIIRDYLVNFTKSVVFSTAMPYTDVYAIEACLSVVSSARGQELRQSLYRCCRYAHDRFRTSLKQVPAHVLAVEETDSSEDPTYERDGVCSPIIPVYVPRPKILEKYLLERGYAVTALDYPFAKSSRIRISIHAGNTEEEIDAFVDELVVWAGRQERATSSTGGRSGDVRAGNSLMEARAKL